MSKPTLFQTLLNRPSQTYYNPAAHQQLQRNDYHSAKQDMLRIAQAAAASDPGPSQNLSLNVNNLQFDSFSNSEYFTPDTSPRSSLVIMSGNPNTNATSRKPKRRSLTDLNTGAQISTAGVSYGGAVPSTRTPSSGSTGGKAPRGTKGQRVIYTLSTHSSLSSTSLDGHSIFSDYLTAAGDSLEDVRVVAGSGAGGPGTTPTTPGETGTGGANLIRSTSTSTRTSARTARTAKGSTSTATATVKSTTTPISRPGKPAASRSGVAVPSTSTGAGPAAAQTKAGATAKPRATPGVSERPTTVSKSVSVPPSGSAPKYRERPPTSAQTRPTPNGLLAPIANPNSTLSQKSTLPTTPANSAKASLPVRNPSITATTKSTTSPPNTTTPTTNKKPKPFNAFAPMPVATRQAPLPPESASKSKSGSSSSVPQPTASTTQGIGTAYTVTSTTKQAQDTDPSSVPSSHTSANATTNAKLPQTLPKPNGIGYGISKTEPVPRPIPSSNANGHASTSNPNVNGIPRRQAQHLPLPTPSKIPNSMMLMVNSMSAVLEEDEDYIDLMDGDGDGKQKKTLRHTTDRGRRRSYGPVQGLGGKGKEKEVPKERQIEDGDTFKINPYAHSNSNSSTSLSSEGQTPTGTRPPPLQRRRSRSLDSGSSRPRLGQTQGLKPQTLSTEVQALTLASGGLPSIGTKGYSGLVLPRAPAPSPLSSERVRGSGFLGNLPTLGLNLKPKVGSDGKVDLTRNGVARTTMATVEVVRGLAESSSGFVSRRGSVKLGRSGSWKVKDVLVSALGRRGSISSGSGAPRPDLREVDAKKLGVENTVLGFTSYRSPPTNVPPRSVLVQVWAVGVDGVDGRLVGVKFGSAASSGSAGGTTDRHEQRGDDGVEETEGADEEESTERVGGSETEIEREETEPVQEEDQMATQSTPFRSKNPFAALGRSLSLSLSLRKRRNGETDPDEEPSTMSKRGRSFSFRTRKEETEDHASAPTPLSRTGSKGMSGKRATQAGLGVGSSMGQEQHEGSGASGSISTSPSKPLKLRARTKGVAGPTTSNGMQVHVHTVKERERPPSLSVPQSSEERPKSTSLRPQAQAQQIDEPHPRSRRKPVPVPPPTPEPVPETDKLKRTKSKPRPRPRVAGVGFIPGRSFVGRIVEVGWELGDEDVRRGEWVVGLVDVRKCGALAEFIVVDRHRVHRVPHPRKAVPKDNPDAPASPIWVREEVSSIEEEQVQVSPSGKIRPEKNKPMPPMPTSVLTLEELALLPLCGIPAYRAVRTFMYAFPGTDDATSSQQAQPLGQTQSRDPYAARRRALVLRGHDGAGAMAAQMLIERGWRVSVHVPFTCVPANATQELADGFMRAVEDRAREWGADEVIFDDGEAEREAERDGSVAAAAVVGDGDDGRAAAVRVMETLREEGDVFDAVLDTVGGKEVREAGERLLRSNGLPFSPAPANGDASTANLTSPGVKQKSYGIGQFTTLVADTPERPIPSAADALRANLRSFRLGLGDSGEAGGTNSKSKSKSAAAADPISSQGKVGYAWVSVAHELSEWEGEDIGETIGAVLRIAMEEGIRPLVEDAGGGILGRPRVVPFEQTPSVFVDNGPLADGGTVVVRVAGA